MIADLGWREQDGGCGVPAVMSHRNTCFNKHSWVRTPLWESGRTTERFQHQVKQNNPRHWCIEEGEDTSLYLSHLSPKVAQHWHLWEIVRIRILGPSIPAKSQVADYTALIIWCKKRIKSGEGTLTSRSPKPISCPQNTVKSFRLLGAPDFTKYRLLKITIAHISWHLT